MAKSSWRSSRKVSGGRYRPLRGKRLMEKQNNSRLTTVGKTKRIVVRIRGGTTKQALLTADFANVYDQKENKHVKSKIKSVVECPANRNYIRRNIMTKGTVIDTEAGKARITSRPGQNGSIEAVLL
ncbi:30S ribosomal protein S8e [Candidatus Woesearchaeota archaeon CG_4_10_14_0_2_um_filter_57_5]|nr:MAG: 30S ribosomal protein S8e [Candidatus Woesearchaeota archaeon CG1_02_57_44]PIZ48805.1 MAG: 30S ribosomal protein S8e [Candidatus Woesearchaeota archaeon CG_4_10_14_0_2_um_filter_57_5]